MADYPGLPNWGYGLHVGLNLGDVLRLLPKSMERRKGEAEIKETEARTGLVGAQAQQINQMTPAELQQVLAQTQRTTELLPLEKEELGASTEQRRAGAGLAREQAESERTMRPYDVYNKAAQGAEATSRAALYQKQPSLEELQLLVQVLQNTLPQQSGAGGQPEANPFYDQLQQAVSQRLGLPPTAPRAQSGPSAADMEAFRQALAGRGAAPQQPGTFGGAVQKGFNESVIGQLVQALGNLMGGSVPPAPQSVQPQPQPQVPTDVPTLTQLLQRIFMQTNFPPELTEPSGKQYYQKRQQKKEDR